MTRAWLRVPVPGTGSSEFRGCFARDGPQPWASRPGSVCAAVPAWGARLLGSGLSPPGAEERSLCIDFFPVFPRAEQGTRPDRRTPRQCQRTRTPELPRGVAGRGSSRPRTAPWTAAQSPRTLGKSGRIPPAAGPREPRATRRQRGPRWGLEPRSRPSGFGRPRDRAALPGRWGIPLPALTVAPCDQRGCEVVPEF